MGLVPLEKRLREVPGPFQFVRTQKEGVGCEPGKGPSAENLIMLVLSSWTSSIRICEK